MKCRASPRGSLYGPLSQKLENHILVLHFWRGYITIRDMYSLTHVCISCNLYSKLYLDYIYKIHPSLMGVRCSPNSRDMKLLKQLAQLATLCNCVSNNSVRTPPLHWTKTPWFAILKTRKPGCLRGRRSSLM
jgi:hypothetical protein